MELGLEHMKPAQLHKVLQEDGLTLDQLKIAVDAGMHMPPEGDRSDMQKWRQRSDRMEGPWSPESINDLNPRRKLFPGMTYSPEDLSPNTPVDYSKMREDNKLKGCPLGGRKGPKIDWTNVQLLSRFLPSLAGSNLCSRCLSLTERVQVHFGGRQDPAEAEDERVQQEAARARAQRQARPPGQLRSQSSRPQRPASNPLRCVTFSHLARVLFLFSRVAFR